MHTTRLAVLALGGILGSLAIPACGLEVPDLNNPGLDELETNPTAVSIGAACTGLLIGHRRNQAAANGFVVQLGILGREAYNFDQADPRYIGELLQGTLNRGSPFGGNFWGGPYANIRLGNIVLRAVDKVTELSLEDKAAIRGFTKTIGALDLLEVIVTHDTNGGVIDTDRPLTDSLGAIVDKAAVYTEITRLLDAAEGDLKAAVPMPDPDATGGAFPFLLSEGYAGFDTPATFLTFNRAIRARVAAYLEDYATVMTALTGSFIDDDTTDGATPDLDLGVYYTYSTKSGDVTNGLINPNIYAHPFLESEAKDDTGDIDARYTRKIGMADKAGSAQGLTSTIAFNKLYSSPSSPVALIRNEELILLKAEALFRGQPANVTAAFAALNLVRTTSGGLAPLAETTDMTNFIDELLYERRYSLMFEWGHRWIDLRRFGRMLLLEMPDHERNIRYPIPLPECNARPDEPRCMLGST